MKKTDIIKECAGWLSVFGFAWMTVTSIFSNVVIPSNIANLGYFLFLVPWLVEMILDGRWHYHYRKEHLLSFAMLLFFAFELFYLPTEGNLYLKKLMEKRYPLVLFAITSLFGYSNKLTLKRLVDAMAVVSSFAVIVVALKAGLWNLIVSPERSYLFSDSRMAMVNSHMMFNFYLNATLIGIWWIWFMVKDRTTWRTVLYAVTVALSMLALAISDGRNGLVTFILLVMVIVTMECWKRWRWRAAIVVALLAMAGFAVLWFNPRLREKGLVEDERYGYWRSASELIVEKPLFGYGVNNAQEEYDKVNHKYQTEYWRTYWFEVMHSKFVDTHNQFVQSTLEFGIVGLLILLSLYILPLVVVDRKRLLLASLVLFLSVMQSMTDMFITGQFCTLYCILTQGIIWFDRD